MAGAVAACSSLVSIELMLEVTGCWHQYSISITVQHADTCLVSEAGLAHRKALRLYDCVAD